MIPIEKVQKLAVKFANVPYESAHHQLCLVCLVRRRVLGDLICMQEIAHGISDNPWVAVFVAPPARRYAVIISRLTNIGVISDAANKPSAFISPVLK